MGWRTAYECSQLDLVHHWVDNKLHSGGDEVSEEMAATLQDVKKTGIIFKEILGFLGYHEDPLLLLRTWGAKPVIIDTSTGKPVIRYDKSGVGGNEFVEVEPEPVVDVAREAWRNAMRERGQEMEYKQLTSDIQAREIHQQRAESFSLYSQQMSIGLNIIVSLATATGVGYYLGHHLFGLHYPHAGWITALIFGTSLLIIEVYLVLSRLTRADAAAAARILRNQQPPLPPVPRQHEAAQHASQSMQDETRYAQQTLRQRRPATDPSSCDNSG